MPLSFSSRSPRDRHLDLREPPFTKPSRALSPSSTRALERSSTTASPSMRRRKNHSRTSNKNPMPPEQTNSLTLKLPSRSTSPLGPSEESKERTGTFRRVQKLSQELFPCPRCLEALNQNVSQFLMGLNPTEHDAESSFGSSDTEEGTELQEPWSSGDFLLPSTKWSSRLRPPIGNHEVSPKHLSDGREFTRLRMPKSTNESEIPSLRCSRTSSAGLRPLHHNRQVSRRLLDLEIANKSLYAVTRKLEEHLNEERRCYRAVRKQLKETTKRLREADANAASSNSKRLNELTTRIQRSEEDGHVLRNEEHEELLLRMVHSTALMITACQESLSSYPGLYSPECEAEDDSDMSTFGTTDLPRLRVRRGGSKRARARTRRAEECSLTESGWGCDTDNDVENFGPPPRTKPQPPVSAARKHHYHQHHHYYHHPAPFASPSVDGTGGESFFEAEENRGHMAEPLHPVVGRTPSLLSHPVLYHRVSGLLRELHKRIEALEAEVPVQHPTTWSRSPKSEISVPPMIAEGIESLSFECTASSPVRTSALPGTGRKGLGLVLSLQDNPSARVLSSEVPPRSRRREVSEASTIFRNLCGALGVPFSEVQNLVAIDESSAAPECPSSQLRPAINHPGSRVWSLARLNGDQSKSLSMTSTQFSWTSSDSTARLTSQPSLEAEESETDRRASSRDYQKAPKRQIPKGSVITSTGLHLHKSRSPVVGTGGLRLTPPCSPGAGLAVPATPRSLPSLGRSFACPPGPPSSITSFSPSIHSEGDMRSTKMAPIYPDLTCLGGPGPKVITKPPVRSQALGSRGAID